MRNLAVFSELAASNCFQRGKELVQVTVPGGLFSLPRRSKRMALQHATCKRARVSALTTAHARADADAHACASIVQTTMLETLIYEIGRMLHVLMHDVQIYLRKRCSIISFAE